MAWGDIPRKEAYFAIWLAIYLLLVLFNHTLAGSLLGDILTIPTASAIFWSCWRFLKR